MKQEKERLFGGPLPSHLTHWHMWPLTTLAHLTLQTKTKDIFLVFSEQLCRWVEVGARDAQGLPPLAQPTPRQSYAPMAGKPAPSSHEPPRQWNQAPVTLI